MDKIRCDWANKSEIEKKYHDEVWGKPLHDEKGLFKMLMLECMQAGLSWYGILIKFDTLCKAYDDFDPSIVKDYDEAKIQELLNDSGVIRNNLKIRGIINNANRYFELVERYGSLEKFLWSYVDYKPIVNNFESIKDVPATTDISDRISKDLKKLGFKYVGSTTVYAFMQATGMVDDHLSSCCCRHNG